jgi:hypothetical protein
LIRCCFHPKPPWFMGFAPAGGPSAPQSQGVNS